MRIWRALNHLHDYRVTILRRLGRVLSFACWESTKMFSRKLDRSKSIFLAIQNDRQLSLTHWKWNIWKEWFWRLWGCTHQCRLSVRISKSILKIPFIIAFLIPARRVNEDVKLASGDYTIPANTTVVIGIFTIHRDPNNYKNPETFNPDNFLPDATQNRNYYSFVPFSAGPRSCVGRKYAMLKLKILLSTIVRNYHIKSNVEEKDFKLQGDIILKRADGFRIVITPSEL